MNITFKPLLDKLGLTTPTTQYTTPALVENLMMKAKGLFGVGDTPVLPGQQPAPPMRMSQGTNFYDSNAFVPNIAKIVGARRNSPFV